MSLLPLQSNTLLTGAGLGAGLNPTNPRALSAMLNPTNPPGSSNSMLNPTNPPGGSHQDHTNPPWVPQQPPAPTRAPSPGNGVDPVWLYADAAVLMAQALRKSRAKVARPADPKLQPRPKSAGNARMGIDAWSAEHRVTALAAGLLSSVIVEGTSLWVLEAGTPTSLGDAVEVFSLDGFQQGMPWDVQVDKVLRAAVEREDRLPEILAQLHDLWPFFESAAGFSLQQVPAAAELLAVAHDWAEHIVMRLKQGAAVLRPVHRSSLVMPLIVTPGHGALPSGHATIAALMSELLHLLLYRSAIDDVRSAQLDRLARRIAFNRVVAGVHFPVDSCAGYALGTQLGRLFAAAAGRPTEPRPLLADDIFAKAGHELKELSSSEPSGRPRLLRPRAADRYRVQQDPDLKRLWARAREQINALR
jgi:PAP2 superfamily